MKIKLLLLWIVIAVTANVVDAQSDTNETEITLVTSDTLTIFGDVFDPDVARPLLLLFHQGGGNARAEYGPLVPRLLDEGFATMAFDLRRGGDRLGGTNRTIDANAPAEWSYCDAAPDLEAVLDYARSRFEDRTIILWGSSFSGALVIRLAAQRPNDVDGVIAFSPASGEPMEGCRPEELSGALSVPAMMLRPKSEADIESVQKQLTSFSSQGHRTFVAENGVHGSSMLNALRTHSDNETTWQEVLSFLRSIERAP